MTPPDPTLQHPDKAAIQRLIGGVASAEEAREVVRHLLTGCARCSQAARETRGDRVVIPTAAQSYDPVFERLRKRLRDPGSAVGSSGPGPHELYRELMGHDAVEALMQVQSTRRYAYLALCELLLRQALGLAGGSSDGGIAQRTGTRAPAATSPATTPATAETVEASGIEQPTAPAPISETARPAQAPETARLVARCAAAAAEVTEMLDLEIYGAPVVQDVRAIAWTYFADPERMHEDLRTAALSFAFAERLLAGGSATMGGRAELLGVQASLATHCGRFAAARGRHTAAAAIHRRAGRPHLAGRTLLKKGTALGNAGDAAGAVRLLVAASDYVEPRREPRLLVWAAHNLAWFLHEDGHPDAARACLDAARHLYRSAHDRRDLHRLRWLEGKLAADFNTAESALLEARDGLIREKLDYEAALASMDLAVRCAGERQGRQMRRRADEMLPLFRAAGLYGDTQLALDSFRRHGQADDPSALLGELDGYLHEIRLPQNPSRLGIAAAAH
jgi:tetratricopeptide (TPR) repeat protein